MITFSTLINLWSCTVYTILFLSFFFLSNYLHYYCIERYYILSDLRTEFHLHQEDRTRVPYKCIHKRLKIILRERAEKITLKSREGASDEWIHRKPLACINVSIFPLDISQEYLSSSTPLTSPQRFINHLVFVNETIFILQEDRYVPRISNIRNVQYIWSTSVREIKHTFGNLRDDVPA